MADESNSDQSTDERLLAQAHEHFKLAEEAESEIRRLALEDLKFRAGDQWPEQIRAERERERKPCLVINRMPQYVRQVTNDQRQNRPSIKVHPVDDKGDIDTAKTIQGIVRHVEYNSNADVAYDTGFEGAVCGGFGYWRVTTEYLSPTSFDQEIYIKRVRNPFSVYFDPFSQEPDGSDSKRAGLTDDLSEDDYKRQFPNSKLAGSSDWQTLGNSDPFWFPAAKTCRIAEYFYIDYRDDTLVLITDGNQTKTVLKSELPKDLPEGVHIVGERDTQVPTVYWCKLNGVEVLKKTKWLGKWIPIIPVYGDELFVDGKRILEGIVRHAKDAHRMSNYWKSAQTETIALAPKAPFIIAEGQIEGYEQQWAEANIKNHAFLSYKPTTIAGIAVPPPQRNVFEAPVQAINQAAMMSVDDIKATTGIYDASLGNQGNETSGIAIQRRNNQSQTANFHLVDNLTRSLRHTGRILVDLIPKVYDTARAARVIGEDGSQRVVKVNEKTQDNGKDVLYDLDAGTYDVVIDVGPSYATKRQEAAASMIDLTKSSPQIMQLAGDIVVKNMDWPQAQELSDRLKKSLPPGLADDADSKNQPLPPQVQSQMQQMNQMIEGLTQKLNQANHVIETKQIEIESKERIEFAKIQSDQSIALAQLESGEATTLLKQEILAIQHRLELLNINQPIESESNGSVGAQGAAQPPLQTPTGGASPGQPMEGNP